MFEGNASYLYVGNVASTAADGAAIETIASGSVAFCTEGNKVEKSATTTGKLRIAKKLASGQLIFSPFFDMATIKNKIGKAYAAPAQQVTYLGYNGSAGNLDSASSTVYTLNLEWLNSQFTINNTPMVFTGAYKTSASASQAELALGLLNSLDGVIDRQPYKWVKTERVSNGTLADWTGVASHMSVTNGLKGVIYTDGAGAAAAGEALADGTIVFIAGATYKVSGTGTTAGFTLDSPYKGSTAEVAGGTTYATNSGLATSVTSWGLKFTGVENSKFDAVNNTWEVTSFVVDASDFSTAEVTESTKPSKGSGYGKEVANMEVYAQFLDKHPHISAYPRTSRREEVDATATYDICSFEINDPTYTSPTTGMTTNHTYRIQVATKVALDGDDVDTVLGVTV